MSHTTQLCNCPALNHRLPLFQASKIPPIYERPTASNISVEEGGVLNVSKSCNRQPLPLSVSRGVRSRPLGEGIAASTKVDTIPLLSPTMESELLKEPWVFPRTKANPTKEEDTAAFPAWEENFQDLSSWCMDTFQAQCDFHIGESTTFKLSGTKYEGNGVSTVEEDEILKGLRSTTDDEKWNLKMDTIKTLTEKSSDNHHLLLSPSELVNKYEKGHEENYASSSWLMSPESTASTSTSSSKQHNTTDVSAPLQSEYRVSNDYACPTSFDSTSQHETWNELPTIETIGSDTFDLLSYLCDDEMRSPEGSVSTDSSAMLKHRSVTVSSPIFTPTSTKVKIEKTSSRSSKRRRTETQRATSTVTSSSVETPTTSSRKSGKPLVSNKGREKITVKAKRGRSETKNYYESESEDDTALLQYRESREKNNEASRKSRMNKKAKESEMAMRATQLEKDNKILKMKVEELEKLVTSMRNALLQSALKKEF